MKSKKRIYVAGGAFGEYIKFIKKLDFEVAKSMEACDAVLFTGGADVYPGYYGEKQHRSTQANPNRDMSEIFDFNKATARGLHKIGICRGSQLMCVLAGGKLIQHVNNHGLAGLHPVITSDGEVLDVTSTHHQMANLTGLPKSAYKLLAWADSRATMMLNGENKDLKQICGALMVKEPEVVYYTKTNTLAIQSHPEFSNYPENSFNYIKGLINQLLENQL